jgi:integration host factor subunit beta
LTSDSSTAAPSGTPAISLKYRSRSEESRATRSSATAMVRVPRFVLRAQNPQLLLRNAEKIVDALFDEITASLARGKRVELRGFGTFFLRVWEARMGRNPRAGVPISVPKKALPRFRAGKEMRERLNRGGE